ncbi:MAG: hypothetical protein HQ574_05530 [Chloroflexi bacterium]|nr:hypothetical protein [Chloroflexota bacterium]
MKSITHTKVFKMDFPAADLFLLFTPEGEKLWAPGWDYKSVDEKAELSEDYVFLTETHDHGSKEAIWIVKEYDPKSHFIQYYKIEPEEKVGVITVKCSAITPSTTNIQVTYKYIALSPSGEEFISGFNSIVYVEFISEWHMLLQDYFQFRV